LMLTCCPASHWGTSWHSLTSEHVALCSLQTGLYLHQGVLLTASYSCSCCIGCLYDQLACTTVQQCQADMAAFTALLGTTLAALAQTWRTHPHDTCATGRH
jgi:hypothetical protein